MNLYHISTKELKRAASTEGFCKKRLSSNTKNLKCLSFFDGLPNDGVVVRCPYGLCAFKTNDYVFCGFAVPGISDERKISEFNKRRAFLSVERLTVEQTDTLARALKQKQEFDIYSYFAHDIAHEISMLKTHIEEAEARRHLMPESQRLTELYCDFLQEYKNYKRQRIESPSFEDNWFLNFDELNRTVGVMTKKIGLYKHLVEGMQNKLVNIASYCDSYIDALESLECDKDSAHVFKSLFMMHSLFSYRIQYTNETLNLMNGVGPKKRTKKRINLYKCLYKVVMFLKPEVNRQGLEKISLNHVPDIFISADQSIYLAFHILLENAVKYAEERTVINVSIASDSCSGVIVCIENKSEPISSDSIAKIEEPGFSGENSINKDSHGFGLAIVHNILKGSGGIATYTYDSNTSTFKAQIQLVEC